MSAVLPAPAAAARFDVAGFLAKAFLVLAGLALALFLLAPMAAIFVRAVQGREGEFVGLQHFAAYFATPALARSVWNSVWVSLAVTAITLPAAFVFAYALTRSRMRFKPALRLIALIPLLAPSLLPAISFIQWFGNQGAAKWLMGGVFGLRRARHHPVRGLQLLPARADDPDRGARAGRRAAVRGRRRARHAPPAPLLHHHPAGLQVRPALRRDGGVQLHHQRLRRAQGDRRQLQRARRRRVQAGDRPAQLLDRRGRGPACCSCPRWWPSPSTGWCAAASPRISRRARCRSCRSTGRCSTT